MYELRVGIILEIYLRFFIDYRQKNWPKWLVTVEFAVNNKIYLATKISPFILNYGRKLRMEADVRIKGKVKEATEFIERIKKVQEKAEMVLRKA